MQVKQLLLLPIVLGLMISLGYNGLLMLQAKTEHVALFMNLLNPRPLETFATSVYDVLRVAGILQLLSFVLLGVSLVKREFLLDGKTYFLKWGVMVMAFAVTTYGFALRAAANHTGAANLFYLLGMLYFVLWFVERRSPKFQNETFERIKLLPLIVTMAYTLGLPGWSKIFNASQSMGVYVGMFKDTFLATLPGGIPPFMYLLGALELVVLTLLLAGLFKGEFLPKRQRTLLSWAMLLGILTFVMLSFGMAVLVNYAGLMSLVFYAVISLGFWAYLSGDEA